MQNRCVKCKLTDDVIELFSDKKSMIDESVAVSAALLPVSGKAGFPLRPVLKNDVSKAN